MTRHRLTNIVMVLLIISIYALMALLDGPSDHSTQLAQAEDLQDAIKTEAARDHFTRAAAQICGNGGWSQDADGGVHCHRRAVRGPGVVLTRMAPAEAQP